jgi:hypothetical protein
MLEISPVTRYTVAKYPHGQFVMSSPLLARSPAARGAVSVALLALLEACDGFGTGTTGPPPVVPELVTENEARQIIEATFAGEGVGFDNDVRFVLRRGPNDSTELELDGFNDSLGVGYEYITESDGADFTWPVRQTLDSLMNDSGPYIKPVSAVFKEGDYHQHLREIVEEFVDTLKANGII